MAKNNNKALKNWGQHRIQAAPFVISATKIRAESWKRQVKGAGDGGGWEMHKVVQFTFSSSKVWLQRQEQKGQLLLSKQQSVSD